MAKFLKVEAGIVSKVIVADQAHIDGRDDGPWISAPDRVGVGFKASGELFVCDCSGDPVTLTAPDPIELEAIAKTNNAGPITYQWKKNGDNIPDETSETLTIDPTTAGSDDGAYTCAVGDGTDNIVTEAVNITVAAA